MKKSVWLLVGLWMVGVAVSAQPWEKVYPKVVKSIKAPKMTGRRVLNIADCGARTDASAEVNQRAINEAIRRCHEEGGGKVVVPAGVWQTGALTLKSRVNLVVERDATLQFVFEPRLYPQELTHLEGLE